MSSDYRRICRDNLRRYGEDTWYEDILSGLYEERTHFIFELLQNAEDARATQVRFVLQPRSLECWHDGRPFNEADVQGICGMGKSTKTADLTQIGKFGIGFKSVYAYTRHPEIHSGDESFTIDGFIKPTAVPPRPLESPWTTLVVLPLDRPGVEGLAAGEIAKRFASLDARTLLFLKTIRRVEWRGGAAGDGAFLREEVVLGGARRIVMRGEGQASTHPESEWRCFSAPIEGQPPDSVLRCEVAFLLGKKPKSDAPAVEAVKGATLHVFFPTSQLTGVGFLIQGPYRTTPARDSVPRDNAENQKLVRKTATVLRRALQELKGEGLLDAQALETLPLVDDRFPQESMFRPLFDEIKTAFQEDELLPALSGGHVKAPGARLSRSFALRELFNDLLMDELFADSPPAKWLVAEITSERTPVLFDYLTEQQRVLEVTPEKVIARLDEPFMRRRGDDWVVALYGFLRQIPSLWQPGSPPWGSPKVARTRPIVRLRDEMHVPPFRPDGTPAAYLRAPAAAGDVPCVKGSIVEAKDAEAFLHDIGLADYDAFAGLKENILGKYKEKGRRITSEENVSDLSYVVSLLADPDREDRSRIESAVAETPIFRCENPSRERECYGFAKMLYFRSEDLTHYFAPEDRGRFVSGRYSEDVLRLARQCGAASEVRVHCRRADYRGRVTVADGHGWHQRGLDRFDPGAEADGLEPALKQPDARRARFVWTEIVLPYKHLIRGVVESSSRQDFSFSSENVQHSKMGSALCRERWLPHGDGFAQPSEMRIRSLPPDFEVDEGAGAALGMQSDDLGKLAEKVGVDADDIAFLRDLKEADSAGYEEFRQWRDSRRPKPAFPQRAAVDPVRRDVRMQEDVGVAPPKEYQERQRRVRTTKPGLNPKEALRPLYTNDADQMVCQVCQDEMPFRGRDKLHYFEAVELAGCDLIRREHHVYYLALCPLCAAKYQEFVKRDESAARALVEALKESGSLTVSLALGESAERLQFVEVHLRDLQSALRSPDGLPPEDQGSGNSGRATEDAAD